MFRHGKRSKKIEYQAAMKRNLINRKTLLMSLYILVQMSIFLQI